MADALPPPPTTAITIRPAQQRIEAALRAGVPLESSCRNGTCRTCRMRLVEGTVAYRVEWPGLSPEEKREGWILPCVALPASALVIAPLPT